MHSKYQLRAGLLRACHFAIDGIPLHPGQHHADDEQQSTRQFQQGLRLFKGGGENTVVARGMGENVVVGIPVPIEIH